MKEAGGGLRRGAGLGRGSSSKGQGLGEGFSFALRGWVSGEAQSLEWVSF